MTTLSRIFRPWTIAASLLAASALGAGCQVCTAMGCSEGLTVSIFGNIEPGRTYTLVLSLVTEYPEVIPFMACEAKAGDRPGVPRLLCESRRPSTVEPGQIRFREHEELTKILVSVSEGGTKLSEKTFEPKYVSAEINGEGCGWCTSGSITVEVPGT